MDSDDAPPPYCPPTLDPALPTDGESLRLWDLACAAIIGTRF
jgi:hypothetical protein